MRAGSSLPSPMVTKYSVVWSGVDLIDEVHEDVVKLGIVVFRLGADNLDCLAIAICSRLFLPSCLVHHAEAIPAVVHVRKALEEIASGSLGLFQLAGFDELNRSVGGCGQLFEFLIDFPGSGKPRKELGFSGALLCATGFGALLARRLVVGNHLALSCLLLGLAALFVLLTAAAVTGIIASRFGHDGQCLSEKDVSLVHSPAGGCHLPRVAARLRSRSCRRRTGSRMCLRWRAAFGQVSAQTASATALAETRA